MTVETRVRLLIVGLACLNLAVWGLKQMEAHVWLNDLARSLGS